MENDERPQHSDDIARLKEHLGDEGMRYHDISRQAELHEICRRWPLLAESEGVAGSLGPDPATFDPRTERA